MLNVPYNKLEVENKEYYFNFLAVNKTTKNKNIKVYRHTGIPADVHTALYASVLYVDLEY